MNLSRKMWTYFQGYYKVEKKNPARMQMVTPARDKGRSHKILVVSRNQIKTFKTKTTEVLRRQAQQTRWHNAWRQ